MTIDTLAPEQRLATQSIDASSAAALAAGYVLIVDGSTSTKVRLPRHGVLIAGRDADVDLHFDNPSVSRRHAELLMVEGKARVRDLESHNGTLVNGERLTEPRLLMNGDIIMLGTVELLYRGPERITRRFLETSVLIKRLEEETDRLRATERSLGVVSIELPRERKWNAPALASAVEDCLGSLDVASFSGDAAVCLVLPERDRNAVAEIAGRVVHELSRRDVAARAGYAMVPADGSEGRAVLAAAREGSLAAKPGESRDAAKNVSELTLGPRIVVVADPAMVRLYELIRRLALSDMPVLISGETGVGKENAAWAVHWHSKRAKGPFVSVNCAALTESLVESELFGHEKGAFTGATSRKEGRIEAAAGGTLFLDEVGELSAPVQAKLLRVLETRCMTRVGSTTEIPVDLRIVAATNRELEDEVKAGRFRRDLFFRLGAALVCLPPLRDRPREISLLAQRFLTEACEKLERAVPELSTGTLLTLGRWTWPGNVRELRNAMQFCAATIDGAVLEPWHLPSTMTPGTERTETPQGTAAAPSHVRPLNDQVHEFEHRLLVDALEACGGVRAHAAQRVGLALRTFKYKLKLHGITGNAPADEP